MKFNCGAKSLQTPEHVGSVVVVVSAAVVVVVGAGVGLSVVVGGVVVVVVGHTQKLALHEQPKSQGVLHPLQLFGSCVVSMQLISAVPGPQQTNPCP